MSGAAERVLALLSDAARAAADPVVLFGVLGAVWGVLCALLLLAVARRLLARRGRSGTRGAQVAALAAHGLDAAEIARRTRLSRDAVGMLLQAQRRPGSRLNLPLAAPIAAPGRSGAAARPRRANRQIVAEAVDARVRAGGPSPAHRLLDALSRSLRTSRARKAAV